MGSQPVELETRADRRLRSDLKRFGVEWLADTGRLLASWLSDAAEPVRLAQGNGHAPLPRRLMAPLFALATGQTGHSGPPSPPGDRPAREPALPADDPPSE